MESQPTKPPKLILGSSSAFRRKLWSEHFPAHTNSYCAPEIDEKAIRHTDAETLTLLIANAKADALVVSLLAQNPEMDALLVCMDQVVCCEGSIREKPETAAEARSFLASYSSGSAATCVNGIVVHNLRTGVRCATKHKPKEQTSHTQQRVTVTLPVNSVGGIPLTNGNCTPVRVAAAARPRT